MDFSHAMEAYLGVNDPAKAHVVAGLGLHLTDVEVLRGKDAREAAAAFEAAARRGGGSGGDSRAPRRDAFAAAKEGIEGGGRGGGASAASASASARRHTVVGQHAAAAAAHASKARAAAAEAAALVDAVAASGTVGKTVGCPNTKACHQCQHQHVPRSCRARRAGPGSHAAGKGGGSGGAAQCGLSYCDGCVRKFYRDGDGGLTRDDVERICPKCRCVCNCRACLRRDPGPPPTVSDKLSESTTRQLYEHFLRRAAAPMLASDAAERKEIDAEIECGVNNGAVAPGYYGYSDASHASGWRLFCDACGSAVANLHRSCWACEVDVCGDCCADLRRGNTVGKPAATLASALIMGGSGGVGGGGGGKRKAHQPPPPPPQPTSSGGGGDRTGGEGWFNASHTEAELSAMPLKKRLKLRAMKAAKEVRSIHWSPYDPVRDVNAVP